MKKIVFLFIFLQFLCACGVALVPVSSGDVTLDEKEKTLTASKDNLKMTVAIAPQSYSFYGMENTFIIFFIILENAGTSDIQVSVDDFIIVDDKNNQAYAMKAEDVGKIIEQNLFYLIPYPYIGYYSENLNYYEGRYLYNPAAPHIYPVSPKDIYLDAFPFGKILVGNNVKGKIYFKKKLTESKVLNLKAVKKDSGYLFNMTYDVK